MITNNIQEESTPVFGDAPEVKAPVENNVLSWEEEKTLLVFEDDEPSVAARLLNSETGDAIELDVFPFSIGRSSTANLLIKHRSVSREHAQIVQQPGGPGFIIQDVASSNGIRINGIKTSKVILSNNDVVKFGDVEFRFETDQEQAVGAASSAAVIDSTSTAVALNDTREADSLDGVNAAPGLNWADIKSRLPFVNAKSASGDGGDAAKSRYPLIAAVAAIVLLSAYLLSPSRRVDIIETPVASAEADPATGAEAPPATKAASSAEEVASGTGSEEYQNEAESVASASSNAETASDVAATARQSTAEVAAATTDTGSVQSDSDGSVDSRVSVSPSAKTSTDDGSAEMMASATSGDAVPDKDQLEAKTEVAEAASADAQVVAAATGLAQTSVDSDTEKAAAVVAKPKPQIIRRSPEWSRAYIRNSLTMYTDGDIENAVRRLRILSRSRRHQTRFRDEAGALADGIEGMYAQYQSGRSLFDSGNHDEAFLVWRSFLVEESSLLPGRESVYASNIKNEVVNLYTQQGNAAYADGRQHDAYLAWQKASAIAPGGEAAGALADLQKRAKQRFIDGYMQESVSLQTATALWRDVTNMVPPANEYHIKAKAKLRLYKNYGS